MTFAGAGTGAGVGVGMHVCVSVCMCVCFSCLRLATDLLNTLQKRSHKLEERNKLKKQKRTTQPSKIDLRRSIDLHIVIRNIRRVVSPTQAVAVSGGTREMSAKVNAFRTLLIPPPFRRSNVPRAQNR